MKKINKVNRAKVFQYRSYGASVKSIAVELLNSGKSVPDVARLLSINVQSLYQWKQKLKKNKIDSIIASVDQLYLANKLESVSSQTDNRVENLKLLISNTKAERDRLKQVIITILQALN